MTDRFADLLRHGEPAGGGRFRGACEDPLTPLGLAAMRAATAARRAPWDLILTSPARRCAGFATELAEALRLPLEVWPDLGERAWGAWEGLAADQLPAADLARFWADPIGFTPPRAETLGDFAQRVLGAWERLLDGSARHPLAITHGGGVRVILGRVLDLPATSLLLVEVPYACLTRLRLPQPPGRPSLMAHGAVPMGSE